MADRNSFSCENCLIVLNTASVDQYNGNSYVKR